MGKKFSEYVKQQPDVISNILKSKEAYVKNFLSHVNKDSKCIILIGSGSSHNAACMAAPYLQELLNIPVNCLTPSMILASTSLCECAFIAISQSGESTSTMQVIDAVHKNNGKVLALCANINSFVAKKADGCVPIMCGDEDIGPKTKGVSATLMTLLVCGLEFAKVHDTIKNTESFEKEFAKAPEHIRTGIQHGLKFFMDNEQVLINAEYMMLVSDIKSEAVFKEGSLKLLETCWLPTFHYEFEEFMHGIHYSIGEGNTTIFFSTEAARARMNKLTQFSNENGANAFVVDIPVNDDSPARNFYLLGMFTKICEQLSLARGIDCDIARYSSFGQYMETKKANN